MRFLLPAVLCGATFSFALGITLPLVRIERFLILSDEPSLIAMISSLWNAGDWPIAALILVFSIIFPAMTPRSMTCCCIARTAPTRCHRSSR